MSESNQNLSSRVRVDSAGRIVIPAEIRNTLGIAPWDELILSEKPDGLHVQTFRQLIAAAQAFFAPYAIPGQSVVDELIRERREEAAKEDRE